MSQPLQPTPIAQPAPTPQPVVPPQYGQEPPQYGAGPAYAPGSAPGAAYAPRAVAPGELSPKSWLAALLLSIFLGEFGIDRFYLGKIGTGILKLITFGGFGIWWLIDVILIIAGAMKDQDGRLLKYQGEPSAPRQY